ncbi:AMP-binding protein [Microbacterium sp. zg.B48]|uniref:AMP-binding protein n=1 Tax=unclassified Microbacterium TaxID=2609290 RepID=UPI00214B36E3|nr:MULTISPECIES: AMP-binding protein [unclassified Microbacterium]MCR2764000.1 AMP-binding protein [Microbacterium sp. zg.B48]MCR2810421.1 AMP-binding protein [Microbacterium sp. zg.B185]WIM18475.1 AMP-binding protein [Microbacterium sp. zg-B185]
MKGHYSDVWQAVAAELPDRPAIATRETTMSYRDFARDAGAFATRLQDAGIRPGDAVAILMYNRPEYLVALFACFATGIAPVPINYRYRATEVAELLQDSQAAALLFPTSLTEVAAAAVADAASTPLLIQVDDGGPRLEGALVYSEIVAGAGQLPPTPPEGGELRLYTGGTTGRPRAVVWGTQDILEVQLYSIYASSGLAAPDTMADVVRVAADPTTPRVATLPLAPFMHGTALFTSMNTLVLGGTVIIHASPRLDADEAVRLAVDKGATRVIVAGDAVALPLVEAAERAGVTRLGDVDSVISSGMRFSDATKERLHRLGDISIIDLLASTEGGPFAVSVTARSEDLPGRLRMLPGAVVLDEQLREVQDTVGARGVLAFRGTLPKGYFGDEEKSRATFPEIRGVRHVMPGDWVEVLDDGCVELLGRGSSVVNTGGEKVYPVEVEDALLAHPSVADAIVFGLPDARFGEALTAIVVPTDGAVVTEADLRAHVEPLLAGYKKPRRILVRPSLERSPHGKIDMARLKQDAAGELAAQDG